MSLKLWSITFTETTVPQNVTDKHVTQKSVEVWLHNKCHKIYLRGPLGMFCLYVILTISCLRAQTKETSSLPTDSWSFLEAPVQAHRDFFYIDCMTVYFNCKYFPKYTRELLECLLEISPSGAKSLRGQWAQTCLVCFLFYNKRSHLRYLRLAVAFGRYAYAANKFTLGANGF